MIEQVLRAVLPILERLGIPYILTGGIAATLHGRPRFTQDIDVVIDPTKAQLSQLLDALNPNFAVNHDAAREAYARHGEFNAIHRTLIFKVDFWFSAGHAFDRSRLVRAQSMEVAPTLIARVATPEDVIVSKLLWLQQGATERSTDDIRGIVRARGAELDLAYLEEMVREMGVQAIWAPLRPEP
jgi:Nucleotidyl transferase AbiEii toxin, Type IV TA system